MSKMPRKIGNSTLDYNLDINKHFDEIVDDLQTLINKLNDNDFNTVNTVDYNNNSLINYLKNNNQYDKYDSYKVYNN